MARNTPLKKYLSIFAGVHVGMMIIVAVVLELLGLDENAGVNMGILIGSAMAAGYYFIKDHQRLPTSSEKSRLIFLSFLISLSISLCFVAGVAIMEPEGAAFIWTLLQEQAAVFLIVMALVSLMYLLVLWFCYGFLLRKQFLAMQKKAASN